MFFKSFMTPDPVALAMSWTIKYTIVAYEVFF